MYTPLDEGLTGLVPLINGYADQPSRFPLAKIIFDGAMMPNPPSLLVAGAMRALLSVQSCTRLLYFVCSILSSTCFNTPNMDFDDDPYARGPPAIHRRSSRGRYILWPMTLLDRPFKCESRLIFEGKGKLSRLSVS